MTQKSWNQSIQSLSIFQKDYSIPNPTEEDLRAGSVQNGSLTNLGEVQMTERTHNDNMVKQYYPLEVYNLHYRLKNTRENSPLL